MSESMLVRTPMIVFGVVRQYQIV